MDGARPVRAPRGTTLTARSWQTEAPLRMLQNNLDPEVAERPDDLVVYGGTGRAARDWRSFDAMVRTLTTLEDDETMLVQSGRPVGVLRTHEWAPRVLIANSQPGRRLGDLAGVPPARAARPDDVRPDDRRARGSTSAPRASCRARTRRSPPCAGQAVRRHAGRHAHPDRRLRRHGRRAAARRHPQRRRLPGRRRRRRPAAPAGRAPLPRRGRRRPRRRHRAGAGRRSASGAPLSVGLVGNCATVLPELLRRGVEIDVVTDQTSAHDPLSLPARGRRPRPTGTTTPRPSPRSSPTGRARRWPGTSRRWSASWTPAPRCSTTATRSATRRGRAATSGRSRSPASCPPTSGRCSARARARSGGRRCPATRTTSRPPTAPSSTCSRTNDHLHRWIRAAQDRVAFQGLPGADLLARLRRARPGRPAVQRAWSPPARSAPRSSSAATTSTAGSVASPYRETEAMADGSDAIADWPLLNALVNTVVRRHLGVDPPRRRRRHRPLDPRRPGRPSPTARALAAQKLERVLTNDPGMGVIRHVDAGYDRAAEVADEQRRPGPDARGRDGSDHSAGGMWARARRADVGRPGRSAGRRPAATAGSPGRRRRRRCASGSPARRSAAAWTW